MSLLLLLRLFLAAIFSVAGLAKLADLAGSRQAMRNFGVPDKLADFFGLLLPLAELAIAVALVVPVAAWWGAIAALALLLIFVAGIGYNLAHGRTPDCHCFGQLHSAPAGWPTLIRNLVLAGLAGVVVGFGGSSTGPDVLESLKGITLVQRFELVAGALVLVVLIGEGALLIQMMSQQGRLLLRIEALEKRQGTPEKPTPGLPLNSPAPVFTLPDLEGKMTASQELHSSGKPLVLLFSEPTCGPCSTLLPEIGQWQREHGEKMVVAVVSRGTVEANRAKVTQAKVTNVFLQKDREIAQAFRAQGTPSAVVVRPDGTIGSALAQGPDQIRGLITAALNGTLPPPPAPRPPALKVGEPAPDFSLPDLAGKTVKLSDFRGKPALVLFWRPSCGYCAKMLPDLKAWEVNARNGAPKLLVVSTDSVADNQAMGLRATVVLDQTGMTIGKKFGALGTPMAVLVDAEGKIASDLATGAPAVLELAGQKQSEVKRA
jgi:thiol-disulfide isomerase/thioredoxin